MSEPVFPLRVDASVTKRIQEFITAAQVPDTESSMMVEYITISLGRHTKDKVKADLEEILPAPEEIAKFLDNVEKDVTESRKAAAATVATKDARKEQDESRRDSRPNSRLERDSRSSRQEPRDSRDDRESRESRDTIRDSRREARGDNSREETSVRGRPTPIRRTHMDEEEEEDERNRSRRPDSRRRSRSPIEERSQKRGRDSNETPSFVIHRTFADDGEGTVAIEPSDERPSKKARTETNSVTNSALDRLNAKLKDKPRPSSPPNEEKPEASTVFTITLDNLAQTAVKQVPKLAAKKLVQQVASQQNQGAEPRDSHVVVAAAQVPKCAFFPNCKKTDCPFFHPTEECKKFPACPFAEKCRYIHPDVPCKFGAKCTRANCNYTHPKKNEVPCKFGAACTNPSCPFFHLKEAKEPCPKGFACDSKEICPFKHPKVVCRYGDACRNKDRCVFSHGSPCPEGGACKVVDCGAAHPAPKNAPVPQAVSEAKSDQSKIAALSESLPKTPPQTEGGDAMDI